MSIIVSREKQSVSELHELSSALGICKDMLHIRLFIQEIRDWGDDLWSTSDVVEMVQTMQESGAADLWSFELQSDVLDRHRGCRAMRIGWLDVPSQPKLRGEWRFNLLR